MPQPRPLLAVATVLTLAAAACSSNDRQLRVDTWPSGATVRVGEGGRVEGQTPTPPMHVVIPEDGSILLVIEKQGYQTIAVPVDELSSSHLFFALQVAPDTERILNAVKALQASVESVGQAVNALRTELERSGRQ